MREFNITEKNSSPEKSKFSLAGGVVLAACLLAGCAGPQLTASANLANLRPEATTLSLVGISGPSAEASQRFSEVFAREAKARGFTIADGGTGGATQVKAYLDSYPAEGGKLAFAWVLQTSEDGRNRAARVSGSSTSSSPATSGWSAFDDAAMRQIAARGLDDLAKVLAGPDAAPAEPPVTE